MFGGLEIKGSSKPAAANGDDKKKEAPAPAQTSAFSFLGGGSPAAAAPEAPAAASAFGFMGGGSSEKPPEKSEVPVTEKKEESGSSGFSFLTQPVEDKKKDGPSPKETTPSSGFNFLATPAPVQETPSLVKSESNDTAGDSGFSFLSQPAEPLKPSEPALEPKKSPTQSSNDMLSTTATTTAAPAPSQPVGSGIVFGGAISKATKKPMTRRRRTQNIGAGAKEPLPTMTMRPEPPTMSGSSSSTSITQSSAPASASFAPPTLDTKSEQESSGNVKTADASLEAARRAEEFMLNKMKAAPQKFSAPPTPPDYSQKDPTSPKDHDYAEAKAAALEAKAQMAKSPPHFRMGGLFKKKGKWGSGNSMERNSSWSSHGGKSIPEPAAVMPQIVTVKTEETAVERIQREQEEMQKAMAERTLAMNREREEAQPKPAPLVVEPPAPPRPKTPPPPPKKKTPTEKLDDLIAEVAKDSMQAMDRVARLRQQRHALLEERNAAENKLLLAAQQISQAETQQGVAVEEEDFDLADRLAAVLEKWEREKTELGRILENITRALTQLNDQRKSVAGAVAECFRKAQSKLVEFQQQEENTERKGDTEFMQKFSNIAKQLSAENERLGKELKHIERDEALAAEERAELDSAIGERTQSIETQRADASQKLHTVQDEIEELRERLAAREAVERQLKSEVAEHNAAIERVKLSFSRQIARVQRKEDSVKENHNEWKAERARYENEKERHDAEVKAHSEALMSHDELMKRLQNEIDIAETLEQVVEKEVVFESSDASESSEDDAENAERADFSELQNKVVEGEAAVDEAIQRVKAAEAVFDGLDVEHQSLVARIPLLESQKKAAAARRDFKAAGRANKEIKDATARLKDCEEELQGEAATRVTAAKVELEQLKADLESKKSILNEKEKEKGVKAMDELAIKIRQLISTRKALCGDSSDDNSVQAIGALVLNSQIKALQKEGEMYGSKFGGWDTRMEGVDDSIESKEKQEASDKGATAKSTGGQKEDRKAKIAEFKELTQMLKDAEVSLEAAVANEDYEEAAELDIIFQRIQSGLEDLGLTDAEMDEALAEAETEAVGCGQDQAESNEPEKEDLMKALDDAIDESVSDEDLEDGDADAAVVDNGGEQEENNAAKDEKEELEESDGANEGDTVSIVDAEGIDDDEAASSSEEATDREAQDEEVSDGEGTMDKPPSPEELDDNEKHNGAERNGDSLKDQQQYLGSDDELPKEKGDLAVEDSENSGPDDNEMPLESNDAEPIDGS